MPTNIIIQIPNSLRSFHTPLNNFFVGMIAKLDVNSHKTTPTTEDIPGIMEKLRGEIVEFEEQLARDKHNVNTLIELMDAANFAFLAYVALRLQGVEHGSDPTNYTKSRRG